MAAVRHHLLQHRWLAAWLVGIALVMRIVVPAGYMPTFVGNSVTIALCSGSGPMTMAMPGMTKHGDTKTEHGKTEMPCGFAGLSAPSLAGADPILLALAVAFIIATALRAVDPRRVELQRFLRPPLRGPPIFA